MLRLLKYELRKTMMSKLILLGITLVAEAVFLAGLWGNRENALTIGAILLFFIAMTGIASSGGNRNKRNSSQPLVVDLEH